MPNHTCAIPAFIRARASWPMACPTACHMVLLKDMPVVIGYANFGAN
eukprot:SAG31_NODE_4677_length_3040_cov_3.849031_2_plen_47_part_00